MRSFEVKKIIYIFITIFFFISIFYIKINYKYLSIIDYDILKLNGYIGWIFFLWSIFSWSTLRKEFINLYNSFLILLYSFTFGQSLLLVFNLVSKESDLLSRLSFSQLINAQIFTLMGLISFHLGALLVCQKPQENSLPQHYTIKNDTSINSLLLAIKYAGIILFVFSFPGFIYDLSKTIILVSKSGYGALFGYQTGGVARATLLENIFEYTSSYFLPSLICLMIFNRNNNKKRNIIVFIMILHILAQLYIGGRGGAVVLILVMILTYHYSVSPISRKQFIFILIGGYFLLSFLGIISQTRNDLNKNLSNYLKIFVDSIGKDNLFFGTISEMGWSMFPLAAVMSIIPSSFAYFKGKSYFYALTSILPNLGFWDIHPAKVYGSGSTWLMDTLNLWSGPGFSIVAEAFRNFGWYGFIVLIGFGILFGKIFSSIDINTIKNRPDLVCIVLIFFNSILLFIRGDNLLIVRPIFYIVIPIFVLIRVIYKELKKREKKIID